MGLYYPFRYAIEKKKKKKERKKSDYRLRHDSAQTDTESECACQFLLENGTKNKIFLRLVSYSGYRSIIFSHLSLVSVTAFERYTYTHTFH